MRVLWFTGTINKKRKSASYGGGGWISSLTKELNNNCNITLSHAFFCNIQELPYKEDNIFRYPMYIQEKSRIAKIIYYWKKGYKNNCPEQEIQLMLDVINEFKPDIIQIFGLESRFCPIIDYTNIPTVIYLQGILNPIFNAFFPVGMNPFSFLFSRFSKREWIYQNAIIYAHKAMRFRALYEREILRKASYLIGRTQFDYKISRFFAPQAKYFSLNEMLKDVFYVANKWEKKDNNKYIIYTTISNVTYKGLDLILKTAKLLKEYSTKDFEWRVAGMNKDSELVKFFEKILSIHSRDVHVKYNGVVAPNELVQHLLESDVFVHPSYIDNSPNSVCEAQLIGIPVIACNVGGVSDFIVPGKTGELIPANAPFELAAILKQDMDIPYLKLYAQKAVDVAAKRHDKKDIIDKLMNIYRYIHKENSY
ncbi:hypothetical protein FACS1894182_06420 [Bacteroidia bacterium]|nr:hypothetical protein FACS1894182_06420 [Bacteroidia bacterium]